MSESILESTKKVLGIEASYKFFDDDIIMHINSAFGTLNQLDVGPPDGFMIADDSSLWNDFIQGEVRLNAVRTYVYMKVRLLFDPPATSFAADAMQKQVEELEWRLNVFREGEKYPWVDPETEPQTTF